MKRLSCIVLPILALIVMGNVLRSNAAQVTPTPQPEDYQWLPTIQTLIAGDEDCTIPCFFGQQPGKTSLTEFEAFSHTFNKTFQEFSDHANSPPFVWRHLYFDLNSSSEWQEFSASFHFENDILSAINVFMTEPFRWWADNPYTLSNVLKKFDQKPDLYLGVNSSVGIVYLALLYRKSGVIFRYTMDIQVQDNNPISADDQPRLFCAYPENVSRLDLWTQSPDDKRPIERFVSGEEPDPVHHLGGGSYLPVRKMTGLHPETFIQQLLDQPDKCIEMLSRQDLLELGYNY